MFKNLYHLPFFYSPDGAPSDPPPGTPPATPPSEGDPPEPGAKPAKVEFTPEQQAEVDRIIKDRLAREKKKGDEAAEQARKAAEAEALAKNQEWQKLAEQRQAELDEKATRIGELEPFQEAARKYSEALGNYAKTLTADLPEHIKALLEKMDPVEQLEYMAANKEALGVKIGPLGVPPSPKPSEKGATTEAKEKARRDFEKWVRRNAF